MLAIIKSFLKSKAQPSPFKEEFMYTPQKGVDPDELPEVDLPNDLHFDDGNTPQSAPFHSLGEQEIQNHEPMTLLNSHDEAIEASGSVIDQLVGFTTSLAQHNHGEVNKAFDHLTKHRRVLERLRLKVRRLVQNEENSQEYMGGFDNVLQNYVLPTLKKYSGNMVALLSFKKIAESNLSTLEGQLRSMDEALKNWGTNASVAKQASELASQQFEGLSKSVSQLQYRVDQVQQACGTCSASIGEFRSQINSLQSLSSLVQPLSFRMDSIEGNISSRFSDMESSFKSAFPKELGSMESRLKTEFQSQLSWLDIASFQRQFEVTNLKLSSLEERLANVTSSQSSGLLSTRLERN